ncbi:MAG: ABC transporter substrate-binding protein [Alphaproteobacteria bacterium]|nr:ABC transporter substrate-binding protein [Alphaproteobacteria bacterium]
MRRLSILLATLCLAIATGSFNAAAQDTKKVWRIGTLFNGSPETHGHYLRWYSEGFARLGYVQGRDYVFVSRWGRGQQDRVPALARDLVAAKVDLIMANGGTPVRSVARATKRIPIVVGSASGLGTWGFVKTLAKPGGNVTGSTAFDPGLEGKRLDLLREVAKGAKRIGFMFQPKKRGRAEFGRTKTAGQKLGVEIKPFAIRSLGDIEGAFQEPETNDRVDALILSSGAIVYFNRKRIAALVKLRKLPTICARQKIKNTGCLIAYVPDRRVMNRRAAIFADKIFKGAYPGDLPVERPTKYTLVVNLKLARAIGITVPSSLLLRADEVIE